MIAASPPAPGLGDNGSWAKRYERLRQLGLQLGAQSLDDAEGLSHFLREGTVSWLQSPAERSAAKPAHLAPHAHAALADRDVTWLLATMVGTALTEAGR